MESSSSVYILPHHTHRIGDETFVFSSRGVFKIESPPEGLDAVSRLSGQIVGAGALKSLGFTGDAETLNALRHVGVLKDINVDREPLRTVMIVADDPYLRDSISDAAASLGVSVVPPADVCPEEAVIVIYQDTYSVEQISSLQSTLPSTSVALTCYRMDWAVYIDNPYIPEICTPDHQDNIAQVTDKSVRSIGDRSHFFALFDELVKRGAPPKVFRADIGNCERGLIAYFLVAKLKQLLGAHHEILRSTEINNNLMIDLRTGRTTSATVRHHRR